MHLLGKLLKNGLKISQKARLRKTKTIFEQQKKELKKLMGRAAHTQFGKHYKFNQILELFDHSDQREFYAQFRKNVPIFNYNSIFKLWWHKTLAGKADVCWPGTVRYFALSSGTSEAASKHIPITAQMTKAMHKTSIRQMLCLGKYDLPEDCFEKGVLMLGGSTRLNQNGHYFEGDLSGIQASKIPFWFQRFYKPGRQISRTTDWTQKLNEIVEKAPEWDLSVVVGVPAWIQIMMEKIIAHYKVDNIHQIWPNLQIFCHGGVAFEPYRKSFENLLGRPLIYIETYLASEGFIAYQARPDTKSMKLVINNGLFVELIPFTEDNFDSDGELLPNAQTLMADQAKTETDYALLISSCAGAWRYLIGDVIRFTDISEGEILIVGRTKHYLSLCGEHLSVENMNKAIEHASKSLNFEVKEFAVAGMPAGSLFGHHWYIGIDQNAPKSEQLAKIIDTHLQAINDDYRTERSHALSVVKVTILPTHIFYGYLKSQGKEGGSIKFPRVLRNAQIQKWQQYLAAQDLADLK